MSAAGTAAMPRRTEREARGRCNGRGREEQREERELCVKVFEIQLMRDHIFHLSLSAPPKLPSNTPSTIPLWRKVSIMNMDRRAILVRESRGSGVGGETEMEAGIKRRGERADEK